MKTRIIFLGVLLLLIAPTSIVNLLAAPQTTKFSTPLEEKLYQAALKEGELIWWDQHSMKEAGRMIQEFNKKYPGIKVTYYEATMDVLGEKFFAEYKAGRETTDIIQAEPYKPFKEQNLLLNISDIIKDVNYPEKFCPKGLWGASVEHTVFSVFYNTKLIAPGDVPRSWEDLLNPKWKGKINLEPRCKLFVWGTKYWGEKWIVDYLKKLKGQNLNLDKGSTHVLTLLSTGEFAISIGPNLHRILILQGKGAPVDQLPISPAVHKGVNATGIPKMSRHPNAAKLFLRWWMSPEGQLLNDKIRFKGNPLPGSGTGQANILAKHKVQLFSSDEWAIDNEERLTDLYTEAIGLSSK